VSACDLGWLQYLTAQQWRTVLTASGRALAAGSVPVLIQCLQRPAQWALR